MNTNTTANNTRNTYTAKEIRENIFPGDYAAEIAEYGPSYYICDAIADIADGRTSIYYSDIMRFISTNPESLAEVIEEGLYDPAHGYDLYKHGQAAEYMTIERDIYDHLPEALKLIALNAVTDAGIDAAEIPAELWDEIAEEIEDNYSNFDKIGEIYDSVFAFVREIIDAAEEITEDADAESVTA